MAHQRIGMFEPIRGREVVSVELLIGKFAMTTVTKYSVTCSCGHVGTIKMKENDQPFSGQWESYSLVDLNGSATGVEGGVLQWDKVFEDMKPTCPKCGSALTQANLA